MVGSAAKDRTARLVLSCVSDSTNSGGVCELAAAAPRSDAGSTDGIVFGSREDVERLLAEKMKGKNKHDYKVITFLGEVFS